LFTRSTRDGVEVNMILFTRSTRDGVEVNMILFTRSTRDGVEDNMLWFAGLVFINGYFRELESRLFIIMKSQSRFTPNGSY